MSKFKRFMFRVSQNLDVGLFCMMIFGFILSIYMATDATDLFRLFASVVIISLITTLLIELLCILASKIKEFKERD